MKRLEILSPVSVIAKDFLLSEIIKEEFINFIKEKFEEDYEIRFTSLQIFLLPKEKEGKRLKGEVNQKIKDAKEKIEKGEEKKIVIAVGGLPVDRIKFSHRGENDVKERKILIEASDENILKKLVG